VGTIALAALYLAIYIAAFIGAILPWIAIPIENLVYWTLLQVIGTILFFTVGLIGAIYAVIALVNAVREAEPRPHTQQNTPIP
jgi:heme/copper-type cytochrome/quinol oxidase subunit 2